MREFMADFFESVNLIIPRFQHRGRNSLSKSISKPNLMPSVKVSRYFYRYTLGYVEIPSATLFKKLSAYLHFATVKQPAAPLLAKLPTLVTIRTPS